MTTSRIALALAFGLAFPWLASAEPTMDAQVDEPVEASVEQTGAAAETASARVAGEVARATFTSGVVEREPLDELRSIDAGAESVAYFTELRGMEGQTVIHRWEYNGELMGEVAFDVGGSRWRVHSTKQLDPSWTGAWTVKVLDMDGNLLSQDEIDLTAVAAVDEPEVAPPAAAME